MIKCSLQCIHSNGEECELHPDKIELREKGLIDEDGEYVTSIVCNKYIYKEIDCGLR